MVLVFAESQNGAFKKAAFEAVTYGAKTAQVLGSECIALTLGDVQEAGALGQYGAARVVNVGAASLNAFDGQVYTKVIADVVNDLAIFG